MKRKSAPKKAEVMQFPGVKPTVHLALDESGLIAFQSIIGEMADSGFTEYRSYEPLVEILAKQMSLIVRRWRDAKAAGDKSAVEMARAFAGLAHSTEACLLKAEAVYRVFLAMDAEFCDDSGDE